ESPDDARNADPLVEVVLVELRKLDARVVQHPYARRAVLPRQRRYRGPGELPRVAHHAQIIGLAVRELVAAVTEAEGVSELVHERRGLLIVVSLWMRDAISVPQRDDEVVPVDFRRPRGRVRATDSWSTRESGQVQEVTEDHIPESLALRVEHVHRIGVRALGERGVVDGLESVEVLTWVGGSIRTGVRLEGDVLVGVLRHRDGRAGRPALETGKRLVVRDGIAVGVLQWVGIDLN